MKIDKIEVKKQYQPLYRTKKPIILVTGGRGSGKSFQTSLFTKRLSYEANQVILYSRYTMTSASDSIIPEIQEKIEFEGDTNNFHVTNNAIINKVSGSPILFRGIKISSGNQTAKLKGIQGLSTFVADEAEEWQSEEDYETLSLSIRSTKATNRVIIIMNPSDINHFIYKKYIENTHKVIQIEGVDIQISTHPDVCHIHTTYLDNLENLSQKFLNEVSEMKLMNIEKYNHKLLGQWSTGKEGYVLKRDWFEIVDYIDFDKYKTDVWIDGAYTEKVTNDPTAITITNYRQNEMIIEHSYTVRLELFELLNKIDSIFEAHNLDKPTVRVFIEPKASGKSIKSMLNKKGYNAIEISNKRAQMGKIARAEDSAPSIHSGKVKLLKGAWNNNFLNEIASFPNSKHDDQVDNLCYACLEYFISYDESMTDHYSNITIN